MISNTIKYLKKKVAKATIDFSAMRAIDSTYTFDAAEISAAADTITIVGHPYKGLEAVGLVLTATTGVTATAPAMSTAYWIIYVDKDTIALATSLALAKAGTKTALIAVGCTDAYLQRDCFGLLTTDCNVPLGSIITEVYYDVLTTFKSWDGAWGAGNEDKATMSIGVAAADDAVAAITIDGTNSVYDSGLHGTLLGAPIWGACADHDTALKGIELELAGWFKTTAESAVNCTIAVDPISQGKIDIYVEYLPPSLAT